MNYSVDSKLIDELQELACTIQYQTDLLCDILEEAILPHSEEFCRYSKEQILSQADGIRLLAKHLDLSTLDVEH